MRGWRCKKGVRERGSVDICIEYIRLFAAVLMTLESE
jgi:hypothetical protein